MAVVTMHELLEAGIHFGHQTRRWNPKMARYIFGERNGIYILDLQKTMRQLHKSYALIRNTVAEGGNVLFVGTKKQAVEPIQREAERCGMYYVNNRWLGGTLTNWTTIRQSIKKLVDLEEMESSGKIEKYKKKEATMMRKARAKLDKNLAGIKNMPGQPKVMFVIDCKREAIAVKEAERLGIPCIGVVDTNCDPDVVPLPVPGNDDAIRAVNLYCKIMADAVMEGRMQFDKVQADRLEDGKGGKRKTAASKVAAKLAPVEEAPAAPAAVAEEAPVAEEAKAESDEKTE